MGVALRVRGTGPLALVEDLATRMATAVDNAMRYRKERETALTLQRSLMPRDLPDLPGLEVAARYLPAAAEAEVGGDWYDVIPIAGGAVGLVMGDVAGKGLAGASMVGRLRSALRAYALEGHDGGRVVEQGTHAELLARGDAYARLWRDAGSDTTIAA